MKRIVILLVALVLMVGSCTMAYAADLSSMSDEELKEQFDAIRNELTVRGLVAAKKTVLLDKAGVQVYISGSPTVEKEYAWSDNLVLLIPIVIVNDSDYNINVISGNSSVNGWTADSTIYEEVPAGKKAKSNIKFELKETDIESIDDFTDAELTLTVYNKDDWFGKNVVDQTAPITIYAEK